MAAVICDLEQLDPLHIALSHELLRQRAEMEQLKEELALCKLTSKLELSENEKVLALCKKDLEYAHRDMEKLQAAVSTLQQQLRETHEKLYIANEKMHEAEKMRLLDMRTSTATGFPSFKF